MTKAKKKDQAQRSDLNAPENDDVRRGGATTDGEVHARFDSGSGETETDDGLDEYQEAARHGAEDVPASERRKKMSDLPVFDRAKVEPKV